MKQGTNLASIPENQYSDYRYDVIFKAYKWDPQVGDHNTVSKHVVLMDQETAEQLAAWSEQLSEETMSKEEALIHNLSIVKKLGLPGKIFKALKNLSGYNRNDHVRLMRFDFHPTTTGWAISEVNSDVPGGLAEASILPSIAAKYFEEYQPGVNILDSLTKAFQEKTEKDSTIAFVHATSYSDDRQVMQCLSDHFNKNEFRTVFAGPDHMKWSDKKPVSILNDLQGKIDGIVRFFPLEWLTNLPRSYNWKGYFDCEVPSCNHPAAILTQSKRLPLIWDQMGVDIPMWKTLLPETREPKKVTRQDKDWIFKPALGRVGEGISIHGVVPEKELIKIEKAAHKEPVNWVAQRKFDSRPLTTEEGDTCHLCIGVFTVDGKFAGFYGRISQYPRIDSNAEDIPVLVAKRG